MLQPVIKTPMKLRQKTGIFADFMTLSSSSLASGSSESHPPTGEKNAIGDAE